MKNIRESVYAGRFYSRLESDLREEIESYLSQSGKVDVPGVVKAIVSPHAGYIYSGLTAGYAYNSLNGQNFNEVVVIGPTHRSQFTGLAGADYDSWKTPLGNLEQIEFPEDFQTYNEAHSHEHSIEVQLPFLQVVLDEFILAPILTGQINDLVTEVSRIDTLLNSESLIVVSTDLSHYLPYEKAKQIDRETIDKILDLDGDFSHERACGRDGIRILIEIAKKNGWKTKLLDYRTSGDTAGDQNRVVGYTSVAFYE